jgi:hypothetical protein
LVFVRLAPLQAALYSAFLKLSIVKNMLTKGSGETKDKVGPGRDKTPRHEMPHLIMPRHREEHVD